MLYPQAPNSTDRSFHYGDGLFTTIRVKDGKVMLWDLHLQRLVEGTKRLLIHPFDTDELTAKVQQAVSAPHQVMKVLISRGMAGRGYSPQGIESPCCYISTAALPDYRAWQQQGIRLDLADFKLAQQPALAGLKHNNRLEQVLIKAELAQTDADELVVLDQSGAVIEVSAANLMFYKEGLWFTPALDQAGVNGVMRQHLMAHRTIREGQFCLDDLQQAEALLICNALMGVVPVKQFAGKTKNIELVRQFISGVEL
ncbi:aminodeoxychorismate lyase [Rheinheimera sediminis]|uniref:aminodeoxychorismate lyase n=1 Tax=Rheinheimera sp. YQF-1 TaxID=2499626 RepID=UPI000FD99620|nr:aminodeoxychorismate lyase [Rheinheimera sp. YQF-1]RVT45263.1 aminodeoxychorismate lyase [Rheinheimera sp. YQF-1]